MSWRKELEDKYTVECRICGYKTVAPDKAPRQKYAKGKCVNCGAVDGKLSITSECHTDDHNVEAQFDAVPWFKKASQEDIVDLAICGWGGDYPADEVAHFMADHVARIADMFKYMEIISQNRAKKDCCGFECHVGSDEALSWLRYNRPSVYKELHQRALI